MRFFLLVISLGCFMITNIGYGDELTSEKKAAIRELLQVTGVMQMETLFGDAFSQQMIQLVQQ